LRQNAMERGVSVERTLSVEEHWPAWAAQNILRTDVTVYQYMLRGYDDLYQPEQLLLETRVGPPAAASRYDSIRDA